jgi:acetyl esterase/lipase
VTGWVDPDLAAALAMIPDLGALSDETLCDIRASLIAPPPQLGRDGDIEVQLISIPHSDGTGANEALLYKPATHNGGLCPALLNIHGGGFVSGSPAREDTAMRQFVRTLSCVILSPTYRLAPEHPFPAAHEDCLSALDWLLHEAPALGIDIARVALRGVSAGGGIALGLALRLRDEHRFALSHLHLIYPMLDDCTAAHPHNGAHIWTAASNRYGWDALLNGQDRAAPSPYAVPARAQDVSGLPPIFLATGSIDLFAGEIVTLANRLIDAGIPTELHIWPGAYHGFGLIAGSRMAAALAEASKAALKRALFD